MMLLQCTWSWSICWWKRGVWGKGGRSRGIGGGGHLCVILLCHSNRLMSSIPPLLCFSGGMKAQSKHCWSPYWSTPWTTPIIMDCISRTTCHGPHITWDTGQVEHRAIRVCNIVLWYEPPISRFCSRGAMHCIQILGGRGGRGEQYGWSSVC